MQPLALQQYDVAFLATHYCENRYIYSVIRSIEVYSNPIPIVNKKPDFSLDGALPSSIRESGLHNSLRITIIR